MAWQLTDPTVVADSRPARGLQVQVILVSGQCHSQLQIIVSLQALSDYVGSVLCPLY